MNDDKLKDTIPLSVTFFQGESPTAEKLEGMMTQVETAFEYLENTTGDAFNRTVYSTTWLNNFARLIGDVSKLNPIILPSYKESGYIQNLTLGETEHELDLIPIGNDQTIISDTNDSSVVIGQYKTSVDLLVEPGDWTIKQTYTENGNQKNEKRLITHAPSDGGSITFAEVTTGKGSADELMTYNIIPSIAQAEDGGPFVDVTLADANTNTYTFTLPTITRQYDKAQDIVDVSLSNTSSHVVGGRQYELPEYFFDPAGLDLESDGAGISPEKSFPGNLMKIYTWEDKQVVEGILEIKASPIVSARRYQFTVRFNSDVILDLNKSYLVSVSGASISDYLRILTHHMVNHKHAGEDMARHVRHSDLIGLRSTSSNFTERSAYYGPSNIKYNDHSMYLHRDGFTDGDTGAGANIMRGSILIGSTETGLAAEHENYNLTEDSYSLYFGHINDSARLFFEKNANHSTVFGRNDIPATFLGEALSITGPIHGSSGFKNLLIDAALRVTKDAVLGSTANDSVIIAGNMYINRSATFIPVDPGLLPLEEGMTYYNATQKELEVYNGTARLGLTRNANDIEVLVGDGLTSWGKFNGANATEIQAAIDEAAAAGGGIVRVLKGLYDFGFGSISIPSNVKIVGTKHETIFVGDARLIDVNGSAAAIENVTIQDIVLRGRNPQKTTFSIDIINGQRIKIKGVDFKYSEFAVRLDENSNYCKVDSECTYEACDVRVRGAQTALNNLTNKIAIEQPIGYTKDINYINWGTKEAFASKLVPSSPSIAVQYVDAPAQNAVGRGALRISGTGVLRFDELMAVSQSGGAGGFCDARKLGATGTLSIGAECFDKDGVLLGTKNFIANNANLPASMQYYYGTMTGDGPDLTDFIAGTRFIRLFINVTANSDGIDLDNLSAYPMTISRLAVFS